MSSLTAPQIAFYSFYELLGMAVKTLGILCLSVMMSVPQASSEYHQSTEGKEKKKTVTITK